MRSATCAFGLVLLVLVGGSRSATADDAAAPASYRSVIDRVDLEPSTLGGYRLRISLSALSLQGQLLDISDRKTVKTMVGSTKLDAPYALGTYAATNSDTAIVIVIQANLTYADALPSILATLDEQVLAALGDRTQLAILPYGGATGTGKLASLKTARGKLQEVSSDGSAGEPALLDSLDRALLLLKRARTSPEGRPIRKLIIAISDGHDRSGDRDRVTNLGKRADKAGVRIESFGYAPTKVLRPLLTLGELSKRSLGTFRWVRSGGAESWAPAFQQLRNEINNQNVLTYFLPSDSDVAGKKLKIVTIGRTEATSNELKIPEAGCGGDACPNGYCSDATCVVPPASSNRGIFGWILLVVGIGVALIVALAVVGFVLSKRQQAVPGQPGVAAMAGAPSPPKPRKRGKQDIQPLPPPPPVAGPSLLVLSGPRNGERIALQNGFTIGKAPTSNLVLDDGYTSTQHAQVGMDQFGNCRLYDRNSTNGTFVNGVRVTEVVLDHGMSVRIGSTELRFLAQ
jgi:hypothetical protein